MNSDPRPGPSRGAPRSRHEPMAARSRPGALSPVVLSAGALVAVVVATALTLVPPPQGIDVPGPFVDYGLAISRALVHTSATAVVGFALLPVLLTAGQEEAPATPLHERSLRLSAVAALVLAPSAGANLLFGAAELYVGSIDSATVVAYLEVSRTGQALAATAVLGLLVSISALMGLRPNVLPRELCLLLSAVPLLPLTLTGHGESSVLHGLMMLSRGGHVVAAALWVGGLLAVIVLLAHRAELAEVLPRFSTIATWSVLTVTATGVVDAGITLLDTPGAIHPGMYLSPYVLICLTKLGCVGVLLLIASVIRFRLLPLIMAGHRASLVGWVIVELSVMGAAFGFAAVLSRTPVAG